MADSGILNIIAHGGPLQTVPQNNQVQAEADLAKSQAQEAQARIPQLQEQAKQAAITTQQNQIALKDQQILSGLMTQSEGDFDKMLKLAPRSGASPSAVFGLQKTIMDAKKQALDNTVEQNKVHADLYDRLRGSLASSLSAQDPTEKQAGWDALRTHIAELPPEVQQLVGPTYPGDQQAQLIDHLLAGGTKITKEALEKQQADKAAADAAKSRADIPKVQAEADKIRTEQATAQKQADATTLAGVLKTQGPEAYQAALGELPYKRAQAFAGAKTVEDILNQGMKPEEQVQAAQRKTNEAETARHNLVDESAARGRLGIEGARLKLDRERLGFDMSGVSPVAQMAVDGRMDPQTLRATIRRTPGVLNQIMALDPKFDEGKIDERYNTLKEFTSTSTGKAGGQAIALNTLIHHADLYQQVGEALKNGSFTPGNALYNKVASVFGSAPPQNAALVARFLAGETGKVATGGVPAEGEIKGILSSLGTNASPEQISQAGKTILQIAAGRATPLMERVKNSNLDNVVHVLGPDAQEILKRQGFDPNTMKPSGGGAQGGKVSVAAGGKTYNFKTQADADAFKAAAGIK